MPKNIKDEAYVINLDEYAGVVTHWIPLHVKDSKIMYFGSFGVEHILKEIGKTIGHKT